MAISHARPTAAARRRAADACPTAAARRRAAHVAFPQMPALDEAHLDELRDRPFGVYVHVPWCASRCGYCDFNTYVSGRVRGAAPAAFAATAAAEARLGSAALAGRAPPAQTVFFGGGTPTLLDAADLAAVLRAIDA